MCLGPSELMRESLLRRFSIQEHALLLRHHVKGAALFPRRILQDIRLQYCPEKCEFQDQVAEKGYESVATQGSEASTIELD